MSPSTTPIRSNRYTPLVVLGRGGMGTVYLAVARGPAGFNKLQVVKYLRSDLAEDDEFRNMFMDEARLSASINHPNIVQTNEVGQEGNQYYIAMEYVEGKTLLSILGRAKKLTPIPLGMHLRIICEALLGLHCAHELHDIDGKPLDVVHRDVSPQNVMVSFEGQVKVLDFGIAKAANSSSETRTGVLKGKFGYMAPEQMLGAGTDRRSDVFSAGVMLWQAITSQRLWKVGTTDMEIFAHVTTGDIPKPSSVAEVPAELERICLRALATKPEDRYPSAEALRHDLESWLRSSGDHTTTRDIGAFVTGLYSEERRALKQAIEERLRAVRSGTATGNIPSLEGHGGGTDSGAQSIDGHSGGGNSLGSSVSRSAHTGIAPAPRSRTTAFVVIAVAVAVAAGVAFALRPSRKSDARGTEANAAAATATAAEKANTELKFAITPPEAAVTIDGQPLVLNGGVGTHPRDNAVHALRIEAPGYIPSSQSVTLDAPRVVLSIALEKAPAAAAHSTTPPAVVGRVAPAAPPRGGARPAAPAASPEPAASPAASPHSSAPAPDTKPSHKPNQPLDQSDPWK